MRTQPATVVVNLSTSLVVEDAARAAGARFVRAAVGEANVARAIRDEGAIIGGEGNGGVMYPALHIGRDAPLGVALILHHSHAGATRLGTRWQRAALRIVKAKAPADRRSGRCMAAAAAFSDAAADERDGLRLAWDDRWLHVRPSGTEPIVRLIAEAPSAAEAEALVGRRPRTLALRVMRDVRHRRLHRTAAGAGLLIEGLRRIEYRGYDSAGIAVVNGDGLKIMKAAGQALGARAAS